VDKLNNWAIGMLATSVAFFAAALVGERWKAWTAAILATAALVSAAALLLRAHRCHPRLEFRVPDLKVVRVGSGRGELVPLSDRDIVPNQELAHFLYVAVANKPLSGSETAERIHIELSYRQFDVATTFVSIPGRWSSTSQDRSMAETQLPEQKDLYVNDVWELIDIGFQYFEDDVCYAVNDQNRFFADDFRWQELRLGWPESVVTVRAIGRNVNVTKDFMLIAGVARKPPRLLPA
jgi:hypothetical protein